MIFFIILLLVIEFLFCYNILNTFIKVSKIQSVFKSYIMSIDDFFEIKRFRKIAFLFEGNL